MTKHEFLERLREALSNDLTGSVIQENVDYYSQYIRSEVETGRSEEEVVQELGDPWVIAQTIIDTADGGHIGNGSTAGENYSYEPGRREYGSGDRQQGGTIRTFGGWKLLLVLLGIIGILLVIVTVIGGILSLIAPILVPVLIISFLLRIFRKRQ